MTHFVSLAFNMALTANRAVVMVQHGPAHPNAGSVSIAAPSRRKPTLRSVTVPFVRDLLRRLDAAVHRELLHGDYHRLPFERRLQWIAAFESADLNPHVHAAWKVPLELTIPFTGLWGSERVRDLWQELLSSGDSHLRPVDDGDAAGGYLVKQRPYARACGHLFLASEFWPDHCRPRRA